MIEQLRHGGDAFALAHLVPALLDGAAGVLRLHPRDGSVRTLFGDGAAATLIRAAAPGDGATIGPFVFGTDGSGAGDLIVEAGAGRTPRSADTAAETTDRTGNVRSRDHLYMNGGAVLNFTLREVPRAVAARQGKASARASGLPRDPASF